MYMTLALQMASLWESWEGWSAVNQCLQLQ